MTDRYNAFISYAWCDNETLDQGGKGWISTFVDRLWKLLRRELPREMAKVPIWLDYEKMRGSDNVTDRIRRELEASRLLVPVISRGYLESPWCTQEREIFIKRHGPDSGRIFPVWMEPIDDLPPELASLLKYQFWYEDDHKQPRTRWFPDIDPTDRDYGLAQQNMARDMAKLLITIEGHGPAATPAGTETAACQAARPRPAENPMVLVNGGEGDAELVLELARCLVDDHGFGAMYPRSLLPDPGDLKSSDISKEFRDKLACCTAVLMVVNHGPSHQVDQQIIECVKSMPQRPKDLPSAAIHICHPANKRPAFSINIPQMRFHPCRDNCVEECARLFTQGLASP
jgi:hypothetical protein